MTTLTPFTRVKSLIDFPLKDFPQSKGRNDDLYELRAKCVRSDGYFLMKCDVGDHFESSFPLMMTSQGAYMLGQIIPTISKALPERIYYDVFIHGGATDAVAFCTSAPQLANVMKVLEARGMEYVFTDNEIWEATEELPFDEIFTQFPSDVRFSVMFGAHNFTGSGLTEEERELIALGGYYE